jgi:nitrite reductase/ring-hydroxylating ferredoxin subunit
MAVYEIGTIEEFPAGSHRVVNIGKIEVGVYNVNGSLYALPNFCPHQQGPLCSGTTSGEWRCSARTGWLHEYERRGEIVVCPWHGIEFDMTTGRCLSSPKLRVRTYTVKVVDGAVSISTDRS